MCRIQRPRPADPPTGGVASARGFPTAGRLAARRLVGEAGGLRAAGLRRRRDPGWHPRVGPRRKITVQWSNSIPCRRTGLQPARRNIIEATPRVKRRPPAPPRSRPSPASASPRSVGRGAGRTRRFGARAAAASRTSISWFIVAQLAWGRGAAGGRCVRRSWRARWVSRAGPSGAPVSTPPAPAWSATGRFPVPRRAATAAARCGSWSSPSSGPARSPSASSRTARRGRAAPSGAARRVGRRRRRLLWRRRPLPPLATPAPPWRSGART